jgi:hypothetical protein
VITGICGLAGASALRVGLQGRKRKERRALGRPKSARAFREVGLPPEAAAVGYFPFAERETTLRSNDLTWKQREIKTERVLRRHVDPGRAPDQPGGAWCAAGAPGRRWPQVQ